MINFHHLVLFVPAVAALENGVARTPPMGFISWQRFGSDVDCVAHPKTCISEKLYLEIAQAMVDKGLLDAGYTYVNIDDNWSTKDRSDDGSVQADPIRFPSGIRDLSSKIRDMGLKFGMYSDIGTYTCQNYPALQVGEDEKNLIADIDRFIDWRIEYLKVDGCYANIESFRTTYPRLSQLIMERLALKNSKLQSEGDEKFKPILLSCSWPAYQKDHGVNEVDLTLLRKYCNTWRNMGDIKDSAAVMKYLAKEYAELSTSSESLLVSAAGPGHWNDPDMLLLGNNGLSDFLQKTQFNLWAIFAAPLYISADVREMNDVVLEILKNPKVIGVNQDPLGRQGWVIDSVEGIIRVWMKPLSPDGATGHARVAVLFESLSEEGNRKDYVFDLKKLRWLENDDWSAIDCYSDSTLQGKISEGADFKIEVDENTSQMYIFSNLSGRHVAYPAHKFSEPPGNIFSGSSDQGQLSPN